MSSAIAAVAVGVGGLYMANESRKDGKKAAGQLNQNMDAQNAIAERQQGMAEEQWGRYKDLYGGLETDIANEAQGYTNEAVYGPAYERQTFSEAAPTHDGARGLKGLVRNGKATFDWEKRKSDFETEQDRLEADSKKPTSYNKVALKRKDYGLDERVTSSVDRAAADVAQSYGRVRRNRTREMGRAGIDPTAGRYDGVEREMDLNEAAGVAGAKTRTRQDGSRFYEGQDWKKKMETLSLGKGLPINASANMSAASSALNSSSNTAANIANINQQQGASDGKFYGQIAGMGLNYLNNRPAVAATPNYTLGPTGGGLDLGTSGSRVPLGSGLDLPAY